MKKIILLIGILLLIQLINAEIIPLTMFSDKEYLGDSQWKFKAYSIPQYYYTDLNELNKIDSNFQGFLFEEWKYQVNKGVYTLGVKDNGTIGFKKNNKGLVLKLKGIGFYNKTTKERILIAEANLSEPTVFGNTVSWQLPLDSNYSVVYENKKFRDRLFMSQQTKDYLITQKPEDWDARNSFVALIFDVNGYNIQLSDFDSNKRINFLDGNKIIFKLPPAKVYHENHYTGEGDVNNFGLEWQKKRVYFNGKYIEAIPVSALQSINGSIRWNTILELELVVSSDDAQETLFGIDLTGDDIAYSTVNSNPGGVIFREVDVEQGTIISEALLNANFVPTCSGAGNCSIDWYGIDQDDTNTWSATHKPGGEAKTTATVNHFNDDDFTPNGSMPNIDLNVTLIVREIITDRVGWVADNNLGFIINLDSIGRFENIKYKTFDYASDSWTLSIEYAGAEPDPCEPDLDEDWRFVNETKLICKDKVIVTGTGKVFIEYNSKLTLINSILNLKDYFYFPPPDLNVEWTTNDGNIDASSNPAFETRATHSPGDNYHSDNHWQSDEVQTDHWIEVDLKNLYFVRTILYPMMFSFNRFSTVDINSFDGLVWKNLFHSTDFNMGTDIDSSCDWNGAGAGGRDYCDKQVTVNAFVQKIRIAVDHDSKSAGSDFDLDSRFAVDNIVVYADYPRAYAYLILTDSNFNVY